MPRSRCRTCSAPESFHPVEEQPPACSPPTNIHRTWKTADGHVVMMIVEDAQFSAICRALEPRGLERDPRFDGLLARLGNGVALYALLEVEARRSGARPSWSSARAGSARRSRP
jgi:crotonobetainyl-CoA:carnitine CoA-transferase CaiB-like acyl-CoA transferase